MHRTFGIRPPQASPEKEPKMECREDASAPAMAAELASLGRAFGRQSFGARGTINGYGLCARPVQSTALRFDCPPAQTVGFKISTHM